ncbi:MAG: PAS domain S-box protein, partial [Ilumatobacteraceae bacterium]
MRSDRRSTVELRSFGFERLNVCAAVLDRRGVVRETNEAWRLVALLNDGTPEGTGVGANYLDVCDRAAAHGDATAAAAAVGLRQILTGDRGHFDLEYVCPFPTDDRWFLLQASSAPVDDGAGIVLFHVDVTAKRLLAARLGIVADDDRHDDRHNDDDDDDDDGGGRRADEPTARSAAHLIDDQLRDAAGTVWVLFLHVDGFDVVQDRYGRRAADELFVQIAARAGSAVRASDRFCRLHRDIFVVSCPNLDEIDATGLAQRLRTAMSEPFHVGDTDLVVAVFTGCAVTGPGAAIDTALEAASAEIEGDVERHRRVPPTELPPLLGPSSPTIGADASALATFDEMIVGRSTSGGQQRDRSTPLPTHVGAAQFQAELLAAAGQAIVAVDLHRTIVYWNRAAEEMYGWSADEAVGRSSTELLPRKETAEQNRAMVAAMRNAQSWSSDYVIERRDGTPVSVYVTNTPIFDDEHRLVLVIGSSVDVTERRAGEEARRQLASIVDGSGDAIFSTTPDGVVTTWNRAAERLFGWSADEIIGQSASVLASPDGAVEQAEMRALIKAGSDYERRETTRRHRDGTVLHVRVAMSTSRDDEGDVIGLSMIAQDITDRLRAERAVHASRAGLAEAQRIAQLGSFEFDVATDRFVWSEELFRILGLDPATVPTTDLFVAAVHPDDLAMLAHAWSNALEHGASFDVELRMHRANGEEGTVRARAVPELADDGSVVKVAGTVMDDTERVTAEQLRRAAETRFEIGFEQSAIGAVIADLEGIPIRVNATACQILGRSPEELVGQRWTAYTPPDELPLVEAVLTGVRTGHDNYQDERRYIRADGTLVWTAATVTLVRNGSGAPQYYFMQLQDVTDRK